MRRTSCFAGYDAKRVRKVPDFQQGIVNEMTGFYALQMTDGLFCIAIENQALKLL